MANDLAKLNRLRVNAGKPELKSWKASQVKLDAAVETLEQAGYNDLLPGANADVPAKTDDPAVKAARPEPEEPPSLADSALAQNIGKEPEKEEKPVTKAKAHLARGLDTDPYARHSRERVRDMREAEREDRRKTKAQLSDEDKKQIKDEAESRKKDKKPTKSERQAKHIEEKRAARKAAGTLKPSKDKDPNTITAADIARDLGIDPKVARAKLRRYEDKKGLPEAREGRTVDLPEGRRISNQENPGRSEVKNSTQLAIAKEYREGTLVMDIARQFSIHPASVSYYAKKHGCTMRKKPKQGAK